MPPRRHPNARDVPLEDVYRHEENAQLQRQVGQLTEELAALTNGNHPPPSSHEKSEDENPVVALNPRQERLKSPDARSRV